MKRLFYVITHYDNDIRREVAQAFEENHGTIGVAEISKRLEERFNYNPGMIAEFDLNELSSEKPIPIDERTARCYEIRKGKIEVNGFYLI